MNTQMVAVYHQSSSQPPGLCGWQLSVIQYTVEQHVACSHKKTYSFSSLHTYLEYRTTMTKALRLIFISFSFPQLSLVIFVFSSHLQIRQIHQFRLDHDETEWPFHIDDNCV